MSKIQITLAIILAVLSVLAIGLCGYALVFNGRLDIALVAGVILLGMAQLLALFSRAASKNEDFEKVKDLMRANDTLSQEQLLLRRRMDRLENDLATGHNATAEQLDAQVRALEHSVSALSRQNSHPAPGQAPAQPAAPGAAGFDHRTEPVFDSAGPPRELDLYLEPIVRLLENRTAYYRATLAVRAGDERVPLSRIAREAERAGYLADLDLAIFERAAPVIRRLKQKGRDIAVFCPVNASSFADDGFMNALLALLNDNLDIANALVVEITQTTLSQLSDRGQEGLAHLAQLGATFALSNARADVPDLATLQELGFEFISADVRLLVAIKNESPHSGDNLLAKIAHSNLQLIAADVVKQSELAWIEDTVPLAYGARFSPPRLVRHDIASPQEQAMVA